MNRKKSIMLLVGIITFMLAITTALAALSSPSDMPHIIGNQILNDNTNTLIAETRDKLTSQDLELKEKIQDAENALAAGDYEKAYDLALEIDSMEKETAESRKSSKIGLAILTLVLVIVSGCALLLHLQKQKRQLKKLQRRQISNMHTTAKPKQRKTGAEIR